MAMATATGRQVESTRPDRLNRGRSQPIRPLLQRYVGRMVLPTMAGIMGMAAFATGAQETVTRPALTVEPALGIQQTLTDNVHLTSTDRRSDLVTQLSPQLRLRSDAGLVRGFLDYSLTGLFYARESSFNNLQQSLSAAGTAEAVDKWAYIDASASISQQSLSALGTQSSDPALLNANRTEVSSLRLAPYVRGRLGTFADYEARLTWASTNSNNSEADSATTEALLRIGSAATTSARLGWSADYSHQAVDFSATGSHEIDRLNGVLTLAVSPELQLSARAGHEVNDLLTLDKENYKTWGWGATWTPTERTRLEATREQRFFGSSHSIRFEHRMSRSVWSFTDTKDLSTDALNGGASAPRTVFDLLFTQFASIAPDPIQRAALVDAFLLGNGLTRATLAHGGLLNTAATIQRNQNFSLALLGLRSTVLISTFRNDTRPVDPASVVSGDLSNGNTLRQRGVAINLSHRLTPLSALSVDYSQTKASTSVSDQSTDLKSLTATWSGRLRERTDLSLSVRRTLFDGAASSYSESALIANLRLWF